MGNLDSNSGVLIVIGMCALVLFIIACKQKAAWLLTLITRIVVNAICIALINSFCKKAGYPYAVGYNFYTLLTSGILGFPGLILLYGIEIVNFL